ncbi:MAG: hypothetical protein ACOZNI_33005 [Myxococcota bacterium]
MLLLSLLLGCPEPDAKACTEIGCDDLVSVAVLDDGGSPVTAFHGTAILPDGAEIAFACNPSASGGDGFDCYENVVHLHTVAETIDLYVLGDASAAEFAGVVTPEYEEVQPNGPDCPPVCEQAEVEVELEGCGDCG